MQEGEWVERRRAPSISDEQLELIADKAAEKALQKVYVEVGKSVLKKLAWMTGLIVVGIFILLSAKGVIR